MAAKNSGGTPPRPKYHFSKFTLHTTSWLGMTGVEQKTATKSTFRCCLLLNALLFSPLFDGLLLEFFPARGPNNSGGTPPRYKYHFSGFTLNTTLGQGKTGVGRKMAMKSTFRCCLNAFVFCFLRTVFFFKSTSPPFQMLSYL